MAVVQNYLPGESLLEKLVYELKSQGIFDQFRKECISDVDTKPAYQNLKQRVEGSVAGFLNKQKWCCDLNKNQVREMLRKNIQESGFLETGVERLVDQVVNPKMNSVFLPKVTDIVYKFFGIQNPNNGQSEHEQFKPSFSCENLLPTDLEAVSPESESMDKRLEISNDSQNLDDSKLDDDESPPFEPIEEQTTYLPPEENSVDSHLSGFSGLVSHDSNHSIDLSKHMQVEVSNQDSILSKHSSDGHLSIVISDDNETKMENCEDSHQSKSSKTNDSNSKHFDVSQDNSNKSTSRQDKKSDHKYDDKSKTEKSKSHDKHKSRRDNKSESKDRKDDKDRKSERDRKDHKDKHNSRDRDKSKDNKDRRDSKSYSKSDGKDSKSEKEKSDKDRSKSSNSSRHRSSSSSREKSSSKKDSISKDKECSESSNRDKSKSSTRDHKDSRSKDDKSKGDSKIHSKHDSKSDKYKKDDKRHSKSEKHSSSSKSKEKDKKDSKKHKKENKDDHFSSKKRFDRRSTDRDSNDGQSGLKSSSSSFDSYVSSQTQNKSQESSNSNSGSGESGNSDSMEEEIVALKAPITFENKDIETIGELLINNEVQTLKLIKPKFASNIHEARRLMKIRKQLDKLEKEDVRNLANVLHGREKYVVEQVMKVNENIAVTPENKNDHKPNILKKQNTFVKTNALLSTPIKVDISEVNHKPKEKTPEPISPPLKTAVVSAATWDALEAKLNQNIDYSTCYDVPDTPDKNEMQVTSTTPPTSRKDEPQVPIDNSNDCRYLSPYISPKTERYIKFVNNLIMKLQKDIESANKRFATISDECKPDLPTINLQSSEPKKPLKRKLTDIHSDVRNNNKKFNHHIEVHENFSLPLSPAESDKSIDKKSDSSESSDKSAKKSGAESTEKVKRTSIRASTKTQRYSSEDLYKPRPLFSGSRRRTGRNLAID